MRLVKKDCYGRWEDLAEVNDMVQWQIAIIIDKFND